MTLLSTIQNACNELGIPAPTTVEDNTDKRAVVLKALARREQLELARMYDWPALRVEYTFTTAAGISTYGLPDEVDKILVDTVYNQSAFYEMRGAMTPAEWRWNVANNNALSTGRGFRTIRQAEVFGEELLPNTSLLAADGHLTLVHWTLPGDGTALSDANAANVLTWDNLLGTPTVGATYRFTCDDTDSTHATLILSVVGSPELAFSTNAAGQFSTDYPVTVAATGVVYIKDGLDLPAIRIANPSLRLVQTVKRGIVITQVPTAEEDVILEYKTNMTAFSAAGAAKALMALNDDTTRLNENLIELGIKWRWLKSRGLDYGEEYRTYVGAVDTRYAQDLTLPAIQLAPRRLTNDRGPITDGYVPDRGYGP